MNNDCLAATRQKILAGLYGQKVATIYEKMAEVLRREIDYYLASQEKWHGAYLFFNEILSAFFPGAICFFYEAEQKFLIHIPYPKNEQNLDKIYLINTLFFEITAQQELFWQKEFAILGRKTTLAPRIEKSIIY